MRSLAVVGFGDVELLGDLLGGGAVAGEDLFLATTFSFGSGCCCIERVLFFEEVVELGRELFRHCSNVVVGYGCVIIFFWATELVGRWGLGARIKLSKYPTNYLVRGLKLLAL